MDFYRNCKPGDYFLIAFFTQIKCMSRTVLFPEKAKIMYDMYTLFFEKSIFY